MGNENSGLIVNQDGFAQQDLASKIKGNISYGRPALSKSTKSTAAMSLMGDRNTVNIEALNNSTFNFQNISQEAYNSKGQYNSLPKGCAAYDSALDFSNKNYWNGEGYNTADNEPQIILPSFQYMFDMKDMEELEFADKIKQINKRQQSIIQKEIVSAQQIHP